MKGVHELFNNILDLFETSHYYLLDGIKEDCVRYLKHW